ncbi:MAG: DDE-type integrase/transposase/recombinase [Burkholderiales bacterium]|nr:DDE-type integrase/transposase/recombinase [Burkholderiales bacterium]
MLRRQRPTGLRVCGDRARHALRAVEIIEKRDAVTVAACLERFLKAFAHPVHTLLTDNGSEFTDRFAVYKKGKPPDRPSGAHPFDRVCAKHGINIS